MNLIRYFLSVGSIKKDVLCWAKGSHQNILNILKYSMSLYYLNLSFPMLKEQPTVTNLNKKREWGSLFRHIQKARCNSCCTRTKTIVI